jgi:hypothetical protein
MSTVYIETSVVSHASARPSADPTIAALQIQAREWWLIQRPKFTLVTSQLVIREASAGDAAAAADQLQMLAGLPLVPIDKAVEQVAAELIARSLIPATAAADALHVAAAASAGVDYLLTQTVGISRTLTSCPVSIPRWRRWACRDC